MLFVSKKDLSFRVALWLPVAVLVIFSLVRPDWFIISITIFVAVLTSWFWFGTYYRIKGGSILKIYGGPFMTKIPIEKINAVRRIKTISAFSALSLDRLEISYGRYGKEVVSPKNKDKFIDALLKINPTIEVDTGEEETAV